MLEFNFCAFQTWIPWTAEIADMKTTYMILYVFCLHTYGEVENLSWIGECDHFLWESYFIYFLILLFFYSLVLFPACPEITKVFWWNPYRMLNEIQTHIILPKLSFNMHWAVCVAWITFFGAYICLVYSKDQKHGWNLTGLDPDHFIWDERWQEIMLYAWWRRGKCWKVWRTCNNFGTGPL